MLDAEASLQQEALGIFGVNLCYGAFFLHHEPEKLIESLLDKLTTGRIEIDLIEFSGIEFRNVDNRLMALKLVQLGLSGAAMFGANREVLQPSDVLHKKAVLVERGSFRPTTHVNLDMLECALEKFKADPAVAGKPILPLMEITMRNLLAGGAEVDRRDFLARAELLAACGMTVLISDYFEYYRLAAYLAWRTKERIGIVMGVPSVVELFDEKYYTQLPGGILESFGRLFKNDFKVYVYPLRRQRRRRVANRRHAQSRTRAAAALRVSRRPRQLRAARQFQPEISPHLFARRAQAHRRAATRAGMKWCRRRWRRSSASAAFSATKKRSNPILIAGRTMSPWPNSMFDPLRNDPRFQKLVASSGSK